MIKLKSKLIQSIKKRSNMTNNTITQQRNFDGWMKQRISNNKIIEQNTRLNIDDELWTILDYFSEVKSKGIDFIKQKNIKKHSPQKIYYMFQGFIRQAKNYYYGAQALHYRSSSLLYYYCLLNLTKAYLILHRPSKLVDTEIGHGLKFDVKDNRAFSKQQIKLRGDGVFSVFYELETGTNLQKDTPLNISNLFSYCFEISGQYELGGFGISKVIPCFSGYAINNEDKKCWAVIGIRRFEQIEPYKYELKCLKRTFEEIHLPRNNSRELFQIHAWEHQYYKFFQNKKPKPWIEGKYLPLKKINEEIMSAFENSFCVNYYPSNYDFVISLPLSPRNKIQMNEELAIFCIYYYLGNLVRYKPEYLEKLLNTKSAWLIESFVRTCSLTFLQIIASKILDQELIFTRL